MYAPNAIKKFQCVRSFFFSFYYSNSNLKFHLNLKATIPSKPSNTLLEVNSTTHNIYYEIKLLCLDILINLRNFFHFQSLLTHVSRPTKNTLNKLGVFTVSSFHAFICARSPSLLNNLLAGRGATKRRPPLLSRSNSGSSRRSMQVSCIMMFLLL